MRPLPPLAPPCVAASGLALLACAKPAFSSFRYRDPAHGAVLQEGIVAAPFETVWGRILSRISQGFFRVTDMRRSTGFIRVAFATKKPGIFIDCGEASRAFGYQWKHRKIDYNPASSVSFEVADTWGPLNNLPVITEVHRKTRLQGHAYIYVAQRDAGTAVSIDANDLLSISVEGKTVEYDAFGSEVATEPVPERQTTVSVTTTEPGHLDLGEGTSRETCRSSGALERGILNLAQP